MSKLNLNDYTDKEIVAAFFRLNASKFLAVINALGAISKRMETRGGLIAQEHSDGAIERLLRQMLEEE